MIPLTGETLMTWLRQPQWRYLPDFLDIPEGTTEGQLCKYDLIVLRVLDGQKPNHIGTATIRQLASLQRLHAAGIVTKRIADGCVFYHMTDYARAILKANASFRAIVPVNAKGDRNELA